MKALELVGIETFKADFDQQVEWSFRGPLSPSFGKLLIIDPQPFRVAAVDYGFKPDPDNNEIAVWRRSDDGNFAWRVRDPAETVRMLLPPQIIGEAMERRVDGPNVALNDIAPDAPARHDSAPLRGSISIPPIARLRPASRAGICAESWVASQTRYRAR